MRDTRLLAHSPQLLVGQQGGSLPGVLVAVAVGSILMGLFITHVSTRMVALSSFDNAQQEQYAADSAVEFASWTLLNDTAFQDAVDAAYPNPVSVSPSIAINGMTPSISAAAVNQRGWSTRASVPNSVNQGGDLGYGDGFLYALEWQGNNMNIWRYNTGADTWTTLTNGPSGAKIKDGAGIVYGGSGRIFVILGNQSDEFWQYTIGGSWEQKEDLPGKADSGSDMVLVGGSIYVLEGGKGMGGDGFWRYSISGDSWSVLAATPDNVSDGGALAADGSFIYAMAGGDTDDFWRYSLGSNSWSSLATTPGDVSDGGSLTYSGNGTLHALQGGGSTALWSYDIGTNNWQSLDAAPGGIGGAGSLTWDLDEYIYALRGDNTTDFWRYLASPPKYDLSVQANGTSLLSRIQLNRPLAEVLWWDWQ